MQRQLKLIPSKEVALQSPFIPPQSGFIANANCFGEHDANGSITVGTIHDQNPRNGYLRSRSRLVLGGWRTDRIVVSERARVAHGFRTAGEPESRSDADARCQRPQSGHEG